MSNEMPMINNESTISADEGTTPYTPRTVYADTRPVIAINTISKNLKSIADSLSTINDFRTGTQLLKDVAELSGRAIQEQWTPDQFNKQLEKIVSNYQFNNPETQARMMRTITLQAVDTATRLAGIQAKISAQKSIADILDLGDKLKNNTHDLSDFQRNFALFSTTVNEAVNKKLINPEAGEKLILQFKDNLINQVIANHMAQDPQGLLKDLQEGKYNGLIDDQTKLKLISTVKQYLQEQLYRQYRQQVIQREEMFFKYTQALGSGKIGIPDIQKADIPIDIKQRLLSLAEKQRKPSLNDTFSYANIEQKILQGKYASLHDLQEEIAQKNLPINLALNLQNKYLLLNAKNYGQARQESGGSSLLPDELDEVLKHPVVKAVESVYVPKVEKAIALFSANSINPLQQTTSKYDTQIYANLFKLRFRNNLAECVEKNGLNCLKNIQSIADKTFQEVVVPFNKEKFIEKNYDYFNNMRIGQPPDKILGFTVRKPQTLDVPKNLATKIVDKLFQLASSSLNPTKDYDISNLLTTPHRLEFQLSDRYKSALGVSSLKCKIQFKDGAIYIIPDNLKLWQKWLELIGEGNE